MESDFHVGITGVTGVGKSTVAGFLGNKLFNYLSLSSFVREETQKRNLLMNRDNFALVARSLRTELGNDFLAKLAINRISNGINKYVIDGLRDPSEIVYLKSKIPIKIVGIQVDDYSILVTRILKRAKVTDILSSEEAILATVQREYDSPELNVKGCLELCDIIIDNSGDLNNLYERIIDFKKSLFTTLIQDDHK